MARKLKLFHNRIKNPVKRSSHKQDPSEFDMKVRNMRRMTLALTGTLLIGFGSILGVRVYSFAQHEPTTNEVANAEYQKISGDIKDRTGKVIATGTDTGGIMEVEKVHVDPLLGVPVGYSKSNFYLRNVMGKELYGLSDPISSLLHSGLLSTRAKGNSVTLTIDSELNKSVYNMMKKSEIDVGAVVVYDYETGEVVANVSYPDYNISGKKYKKLLGDNDLVSRTAKNGGGVNRCTMETYMPASSIKPIIYASLFTLNPDLIRFHCTCTGQWKNKNGTKITDHGHGKTGVADAIASSCNIYPQLLVAKVPNKKLKAFLIDELEFSKKERKTAEGLLYYGGKLDLSDRDQKAMSLIGEGNAQISPLMLARLYGAIMNNGDMAVPRYTMVSETSMKHVFSKKAAKAVRGGMRDAVTESKGTCHMLSDIKIKGAKVYAKSGTGDDSNRTSWCVSAVKFADKNYVVVTGVFRSSGNATTNAKELNKSILKKIYS